MFLGLGLSLTAIGRALDPYAIGGFSPKLVFAPKDDAYRTGGNATTFAGMVDYTGASNKTMVDSDGVLKWAPHNLLTWSEDLTNAAWVKIVATITSNAIVAPNGTSTGDRLSSGTGGGTAFSRVVQDVTTSLLSSQNAIIYAKADTASWLLLQMGSFSSPASGGVYFDLVSGAVGTANAGFSGFIQSVGDGWYRCEVRWATGASDGTGQFQVFVTDANNSATCTQDGRGLYVWGAHLYRSDLGGMADNPDRGDSYVPTTSAARYLSRRGHHVYEGGEWVDAGMLVEPTAATNLLLNSATLSTQDVTVSAQAYTLHFTGTGTITLSGASTAGPLVGTGTGENNRVRLTFTPSAGTLTVTVSGTVTNAQLEAGSVPSSYIPTAGSTATRAAETVSIAAAKLPYSAAAMSIAMRGRMTYADTGTGVIGTGISGEVVFLSWRVDNSNYIAQSLDTTAARTGMVVFEQESAGVWDTLVSSGSYFSPGINVPFNIASRHGSTFINGAVDGVALTADTTPTSLPNLSATPLSLAFSVGPMIIEEFTMFDTDLGDSGISEASA